MASPPAPERDWASQAADTIESVVGRISEKTTGIPTTIARALVYGLMGAILGTVAVVLLVIGLVRLVDYLIPGEVWSAYLTLGGTFVLVGLFFFRKRTSPEGNP